jgi:hypothetical protein
MANSSDAIWLSNLDLADRYTVSRETVRGWRKTGGGPRGHKLGGQVRYKLEDVVKWENASAENPNDTA